MWRPQESPDFNSASADLDEVAWRCLLKTSVNWRRSVSEIQHLCVGCWVSKTMPPFYWAELLPLDCDCQLT